MKYHVANKISSSVTAAHLRSAMAAAALFQVASLSPSLAVSYGETPPATQEGDSNPATTYALGLKHLKGDGLPKNDAEAYRLIRQAADAGHADALGAVGYFYSVGLGVEHNDTQARRYFEMGAEKGSAEAQVNLGKFLIEGRGGISDSKTGVAWIEKAIAQGSLGAAIILGEMYYFGDVSKGDPDYRKAYDLLIPSAVAGSARAQNMIGVMIRDGRTGPANPAAAREWFEKAAVQGEAKACSNLGHLLGPDSTERSVRIAALKWLLLAKSLNETTAAYTLTDIGSSLAPDELREAQKLAVETQQTLAGKR